MSVPLKFKFPLSTLVQDGDYIIKAGEARPEINPRLKTNFVADMRALHTKLKAEIPAQASAKAGLGQLTTAQNAALKTARQLVSQARKSATLAFPGQDVKLHNEFQVGASDAQSLGAFLQSARIIKASCEVPASAAALGENGWIASDTAALDTAIETLDTVDDTQEESKGTGKGSTDARNIDANSLYDGLLKIQNAGDLQFPASDPANGPARVAFRLGLFPPKHGGSKPPPPAPPTPPPA
jgi:hypothetical protein